MSKEPTLHPCKRCKEKVFIEKIETSIKGIYTYKVQCKCREINAISKEFISEIWNKENC